ncbi:hypothetical protein [Thalassovita mangrovi]|uniref:Uncharacterized protein n=1 Tax=Thalassovita mangrovi TaxID=2692236 RepID=A0A6L8LGI1_9RHOB|nr:hypothetical protein [Thalassovita mangrovi]MYM55048.1 hypothetical protein [Thalassovita mangrovi]
MIEVTFDTGFAEVRFWAKGEGISGHRSGPKTWPKPVTPGPIDWCHLDALVLNCSAGSVFEVGLDYTEKHGWKAWEEGGEALMCALFEHVDGHQAAIGLRDYEWAEEHMNLTVQDAAKLPAKAWAKYKANSSAEREFEISLALTNSPADDMEALSPWLYVDKILKF